MFVVNSTDMRKDFGRYIDTIVRSKPVFVKRSRDYFMGISIDMARELVIDVKFNAIKYIEEDSSITLSLEAFDLVVNEPSEEEAINSLIKDLRVYANEYYEDIDFWSSDINRKKQINSILKILLTEDDTSLKEDILCQTGRN